MRAGTCLQAAPGAVGAPPSSEGGPDPDPAATTTSVTRRLEDMTAAISEALAALSDRSMQAQVLDLVRSIELSTLRHDVDLWDALRQHPPLLVWVEQALRVHVADLGVAASAVHLLHRVVRATRTPERPSFLPLAPLVDEALSRHRGVVPLLASGVALLRVMSVGDGCEVSLGLCCVLSSSGCSQVFPPSISSCARGGAAAIVGGGRGPPAAHVASASCSPCMLPHVCAQGAPHGVPWTRREGPA
jgi:hypothetical protein